MRLARFKRSPEGHSLRVGEVPAPEWDLAQAMDVRQQFGEMHRRLYGPMISRAERVLSKDDARDAVADASLALWSCWFALPHEKRNDAYVFGVLHNCISAKLKANSQLVSLDDAEREFGEFAARTGHDDTRGDPRVEVLEAVLAAMPPRRREVLLLVREQGFEYKEAAKALGLTVGAINAHIHLALVDLRAAFTRAGFRIAKLQPRRLSSPKGGDNND